jgi:hypothetical protein
MYNRCFATEISVAGDTRLAVGQAMNRQMKPAGISSERFFQIVAGR